MGGAKAIHTGQGKSQGWEKNRTDRIRSHQNLCKRPGGPHQSPEQIYKTVAVMKYALIIGNNKYDDPKLAQLKTPAADSQALAKVLDDRTIGSLDRKST